MDAGGWREGGKDRIPRGGNGRSAHSRACIYTALPGNVDGANAAQPVT